VALRPENTDDWRARAAYARRKAAEAEAAEERKAWLAIAGDCQERANHPCELGPSAIRVRAEIPQVEQMAQGAAPEIAATVEELAGEMRDVARGLEALGNRQVRKR
jgi:hypothetical protein